MTTTTTTESLTATQAQAINERIASRYEGMTFAPLDRKADRSRNHQRGYRKSPKRKAIL